MCIVYQRMQNCELNELCSVVVYSLRVFIQSISSQVENKRLKQNASDRNLKSKGFKEKLGWIMHKWYIFFFFSIF